MLICRPLDCLSCRIIVCGMRQLNPRDTENLAEIAWRYKDKGVAGFDLAGPEYGFRSKTHKVQHVLSCLLTFSLIPPIAM